MATILSVCRCRVKPSRWCSVLRKGRLPHRLVGEAADGDEAERVLKARRPDLVLVDLPSFGDHAPELCRQLALAGRAFGEPPTVVALAPRLDDEERTALLEAGASGYILTTIDESSLAIAVQAIAEVTGADRACGRNDGRPSNGSRSRFLGTSPGSPGGSS